jgi:hypothetical protein
VPDPVAFRHNFLRDLLRFPNETQVTRNGGDLLDRTEGAGCLVPASLPPAQNHAETITAGIYDWRNGAQAPFCGAAIRQPEVSKWVISVIFDALADVGYPPNRDRDSYLPVGRSVPEAQCKQKTRLFDHLVGGVQ